jgi:hypothetical protein
MIHDGEPLQSTENQRRLPEIGKTFADCEGEINFPCPLPGLRGFPEQMSRTNVRRGAAVEREAGISKHLQWVRQSA